MLRRLSNIILVPATLCLMATSCQSGADEPPTSRGNKVVFATEVASRTTLVSNSNITDHSFLVYGDMKRIDPQPGDPLITILNGAEVSYDPSARQWSYDDTRYWFPEFQHSFVALYPATTPCVSARQYSNSKLTFTYRYPIDNYKDATDVLVTAHRRNYDGQNGGDIVFRFGHILSNFNINSKYTNPVAGAQPLVINEITFYNIPVRGDYSITPSPITGGSSMTYDFDPAPDTYDGWSITERGILKIEFPASGDEARILPPDEKTYSLFSNSDGLLLIPNPDVSTEMMVKYTVYDDGEWRLKTERFAVPQGWRSGYSYTLSLHIDNRKVLFNIDVAEWEYTKEIETEVPRK